MAVVLLVRTRYRWQFFGMKALYSPCGLLGACGFWEDERGISVFEGLGWAVRWKLESAGVFPSFALGSIDVERHP